MMLKRLNWPWLLVAVLMAVSVVLFMRGASDRQALLEAEREQSQANQSAAVEGADLADQVTAACERDDPTGMSVREAGLCQSAEDTKESIVDTIDPSTPTPAPSAKPIPPSQTQVLTAVSVLLPPAVRDSVFMLLPGNLDAYCAARNGCIGRDGVNGTNGTTPSDERLISLITPLIPAPIPGAPGANGVNGADGRGIASLSCSSSVSFEYTVTYTDGSTQTVSCGPAPLPPVVVDPPLEPAA